MGLGKRHEGRLGVLLVHPCEGQQSGQTEPEVLVDMRGLSPEAAGCLWSPAHHSGGTRAWEIVSFPGMNTCPVRLLWLCTGKPGPLLSGQKEWGHAGSQKDHLHFQTLSGTLP